MEDDDHDGQDFNSDEDDDNDVDIIDEEENEGEDEKIDDNELGGVRRGQRAVPDAERITSRFMTKYERARILGSRAL